MILNFIGAKFPIDEDVHLSDVDVISISAYYLVVPGSEIGLEVSYCDRFYVFFLSCFRMT